MCVSALCACFVPMEITRGSPGTEVANGFELSCMWVLGMEHGTFGSQLSSVSILSSKILAL